ncbi:hypothetical protein [Longispora urticae]
MFGISRAEAVTVAKIILMVLGVEVLSATQVMCVVRCLQGDLVCGQRLRAVGHDGEDVPSAGPLTVAGMWRYEIAVDLVDAPHSAKVLLTGTLGEGGSGVRLVGASLPSREAAGAAAQGAGVAIRAVPQDTSPAESHVWFTTS